MHGSGLGVVVRSANPDARLAERALREGWPVPEDRRAGLVKVLLDLVEAPETGARERIAAVKALLGASRLNLEALRVSMAADEFQLLRDRLAGLQGVPGVGLGGGGEGVADGDAG